MKSQSLSPRGSVSLPPRTESAGAASPSTTTPLSIDADPGGVRRMNTLIQRIDALNCKGGADAMCDAADKLMNEIRSEPDAHVSTLLLHLTAKMYTTAMTTESEDLGKRAVAYLDALKTVSEHFGPPSLEELLLARPPKGVFSELEAALKEIAAPIIGARIDRLGLPSRQEGAQLGKGFEEPSSSSDEKTPWKREVSSIQRAIRKFDLKSDPLRVKLKDLAKQAEAGLESGSKDYDLAYLFEMRSRTPRDSR